MQARNSNIISTTCDTAAHLHDTTLRSHVDVVIITTGLDMEVATQEEVGHMPGLLFWYELQLGSCG